MTSACDGTRPTWPNSSTKPFHPPALAVLIKEYPFNFVSKPLTPLKKVQKSDFSTRDLLNI